MKGNISTTCYGCVLLLALIGAGCRPKEQQATIEPHRPLFHFSPPLGWMNDPNGLVYHQGEYHLFYQHYPDSTVWGPMHWGHAVSRDLINWQHLPIALYPDSLGYIFSGSAVADTANTSGLAHQPLVAVFTYDKQGFETQAVAFSADNGRSWQKYDKNPVIKNPGEKDFRDPKVFWHQPSGYWIMSLAVKDHIAFYRSANLTEWEKTGTFGKEYGSHGGVWECPDLFPLSHTPTGTTKWILLVSINPGGPNGGSATQYFIGQFDGKTFTCDEDPATVHWLDYGPDNYAGVTWNNTPDQRRIFIGWMSNWNYGQVVPTDTWRSAMTLPRELSLHQVDNSYYVASLPVKQLEMLRISEQVLETGRDIPFNALAELELTLNLTDETDEAGVEFTNSRNEQLRIGYYRPTNRFYIDRSKAGQTNFSPQFVQVTYAPRTAKTQQVTMRMVLDVASVELFADNGLTCLTSIFFPSEKFNRFRLYHSGSTSPFGPCKWYALKQADFKKME